MDERRNTVEDYSQSKPSCVSSYDFGPMLAEKNIKDIIGITQVLFGFIGPLKLDGDFANGELLVKAY